MNGRIQTRDVEGLVEAVNAKGVRVAGEWLNLSQFHPVELPEAGARVRLDVDLKGYIRSLDVLTASPAHTSAAFPADKDERITRLAVLKAAANFVGLMSQTREDVKSEHVLALADKWLAWVEERPA